MAGLTTVMRLGRRACVCVLALTVLSAALPSLAAASGKPTESPSSSGKKVSPPPAPSSDDSGDGTTPNDDAAPNPSVLSSFTFEPIGAQTAGSAFEATVTARAANGNVMRSYAGTPTIGGNLGASSAGCGGACEAIYGEFSEFRQGVAVVSITGFKAQQGVVLTVEDGDASAKSDAFEVRAAAVSVAKSEVLLDRSELPADGSGTATVTVRLKDLYGNTTANSDTEVTITSSDEGDLSSVEDHGDGTFSATLTAPSSAGTTWLSAFADDQLLGEKVQLTFVAVEPPPVEDVPQPADVYEVVPAVATSKGGEVVTQTATTSIEALTAAQPIRTTISAWADFTDPSITSASLTVDVQDEQPQLPADHAGPGYSMLGLQQTLTISKTVDGSESRAEGTPENPFVVEFRLSSEFVPAGIATGDLMTYRNGKLVRNCTSSGSYMGPSDADDPCVTKRSRLDDGSIAMTVHIIAASQWNFFVATGESTPEPTEPITSDPEPSLPADDPAPVVVAPQPNPPKSYPAPVVVAPEPVTSQDPVQDEPEDAIVPGDSSQGDDDDLTTPAPSQPDNSAGPAQQQLPGPQVRWWSRPLSPPKGKMLSLMTYLKRCDGNEGTEMTLFRTIKGKTVKLKSQQLDESCRTTFTVRASYKVATYKAVWKKQSEDFRKGRSTVLKVRTR